MPLPPDGPAKLAGVDIGPGRSITPDPSFASSTAVGPVLWVGTAPARDGGKLWRSLRRLFPTTGLWPVLLGGLNGKPENPWLHGDLSPMPVAEGDPLSTLEERWNAGVPSEIDEEPDSGDVLKPFGPAFPGLATVTGKALSDNDVDRVGNAVAKGRHLGLVEVSRPADVPAVVGWMGSVNVIEAGTISSILRSWEDRFGVVLVGMEFDTMTLAVSRPPTNDQECLAVAAEHYAFCPDNISQGVGSIGAYAKQLRKLSRWDFWWD